MKGGKTMHQLVPIIVAVVFHLLDLITGLIGAVRNKDINSAKMRDGLFKKVGFIFCYVLAFLMDNYGAEIGLKIGVSVLPIIVLYAVTTEIVSIIENISKINPDLVPKTLKQLFHITDEGSEK